MVKVKYVGPHDAVDLPLPDGGVVRVERGAEVDVHHELRDELVKQEGNWEQSKPTSSRSTASESDSEDDDSE